MNKQVLDKVAETSANVETLYFLVKEGKVNAEELYKVLVQVSTQLQPFLTKQG